MSETREEKAARARSICAAFFESHAEAHPEEASSLGLWAHASRLSDPSRAASERECARLGDVLVEAEALLGRSAGGETELDLDARLDLDAVARFVRHRVRYVDHDRDASNLEVATIPNGALQHAALHATTRGDLVRVAERARAAPGFLASHLENMRRGAREGRAPDSSIVAAFVERVLPGASSSCAILATDLAERLGRTHEAELAAIDEAARGAADAYRSFARAVEEEIAPRARRNVALGEDETAFRLHEVMGIIETSLDQLRVLATRWLARAHERLVDHDALLALLAKKPATLEDALALYRRHTDDAVRLIAERDLLPLPAPLALSLVPLPGGIADGASLTNWPAPLLDPHGHGHALHSRDPRDHPIVQTKNLSVHEGIPGHYLQSVVWQRGQKSPVRFLGIIDDLACARGYFGTMMAVEGWAVHMEHLFREEGFYDDGDEAVFEAFVASIHAARVLCDLEVHAEGMGDDEAAARFAERTHMPERWARNQVLRSRRIPLQSSTYLLGANEIERLRDSAFAHGVSKRDFYAALLEHGPVPMSRLTGIYERR